MNSHGVDIAVTGKSLPKISVDQQNIVFSITILITTPKQPGDMDRWDGGGAAGRIT